MPYIQGSKMLLWAYGSAHFFGIVYIFGLVWFVLSSEKKQKSRRQNTQVIILKYEIWTTVAAAQIFLNHGMVTHYHRNEAVIPWEGKSEWLKEDDE